jgi:hypothetical protein
MNVKVGIFMPSPECHGDRENGGGGEEGGSSSRKRENVWTKKASFIRSDA